MAQTETAPKATKPAGVIVNDPDLKAEAGISKLMAPLSVQDKGFVFEWFNRKYAEFNPNKSEANGQ